MDTVKYVDRQHSLPLRQTDIAARNAANYVGDKANEAVSGASKETNKQVAKDSDAPLGSRASAAKDAVGDKMDEHKHGVCLMKAFDVREANRPRRLPPLSTRSRPSTKQLAA